MGVFHRRGKKGCKTALLSSGNYRSGTITAARDMKQGDITPAGLDGPVIDQVTVNPSM